MPESCEKVVIIFADGIVKAGYAEKFEGGMVLVFKGERVVIYDCDIESIEEI